MKVRVRSKEAVLNRSRRSLTPCGRRVEVFIFISSFRFPFDFCNGSDDPVSAVQLTTPTRAVTDDCFLPFERLFSYAMGMLDTAGEITRLLDQVQAGDKAAESQLMEAVYPKLRRIAAHHLQRERAGHTLQVTALVNEAYLQLLGRSNIEWGNRVHFFAAAAQSMRRILIDYARTRKAAKREGQRQRVEWSDVLAISEDREPEPWPTVASSRCRCGRMSPPRTAVPVTSL